jgi:TPR repeat protein
MQPNDYDSYEEASRAKKRGDHARVREIYEGLVKAGDVYALVMLGSIYARGQGVPVDLDKAESLFNRAAARGSVEAVFQMSNVWYDRDDASLLPRH